MEPLQGSAGFFSDYSELLLFSESEAMPCHPAALCHQGGYCYRHATGHPKHPDSILLRPTCIYYHVSPEKAEKEVGRQGSVNQEQN